MKRLPALTAAARDTNHPCPHALNRATRGTRAWLAAAATGALLGPPLGAAAQTAEPQRVEVSGFRGKQSAGVKYTRPLQDTPRIVTVLPEALLQEQGVQSLSDALRNLPGISLQAGEGNPPGGDQLKIRGFNARDDINVNGTRDLGNYFRDPFYVEQLEVVKGPNSSFSGRGSAGGTVNFVTKTARREAATRVEFSAGTDSLARATLDLNRPLGDNAAFRVNLMVHDSGVPGRDTVEEKRHGLYAAYTWGFAGATRVSADLLHTRQNDIPDAGLPLDRDPSSAHSRGTGALPPGLNFDSYYGHVDDYKDIAVTQLGLVLEHELAPNLLLRNQTRLSRVSNDSVTSSPRVRDIPATSPGFAGARVRGDTKPRDQVDEGLSNQTALVSRFRTGGVQHDLVTGVEFAQLRYENRRRPDVSGPLTDLYVPQPRNRPATPYDGTVYSFETEELAVYALDTLKLAPQWELNLGLRWDRVKATAAEAGRENLPTPGDNRRLTRSDDAVSGSLGLVWKLRPDLSLYASAGTAFEIAGNFDRNQVQLAGGATARVADEATFQIDPEKTTAFELGAKWRAGTDLDVNAAVFQTRKNRARFPGQAGGDNSVLDAELQVSGFELLTAGRVTRSWRLYAGYTFLDSEVQAAPSRPFAVGQPLGGTPRHSFNVFTLVDITPSVALGGGLQHATQSFASVQATAAGTRKVLIPGYTVADLYAQWRVAAQTRLQLNVYNLGNKRYLAQVAEGGGQGIPGPARHAVLTLRHDF